MRKLSNKERSRLQYIRRRYAQGKLGVWQYHLALLPYYEKNL